VVWSSPTTLRERLIGALLPKSLVATIVIFAVSGRVGVPEIRPSSLKDKPAGKEPLSILHLASLPSVVISIWL